MTSPPLKAVRHRYSLHGYSVFHRNHISEQVLNPTGTDVPQLLGYSYSSLSQRIITQSSVVLWLCRPKLQVTDGKTDFETNGPGISVPIFVRWLCVILGLKNTLKKVVCKINSITVSMVNIKIFSQSGYCQTTNDEPLL